MELLSHQIINRNNAVNYETLPKQYNQKIKPV